MKDFSMTTTVTMMTIRDPWTAPFFLSSEITNETASVCFGGLWIPDKDLADELDAIIYEEQLASLSD